ncbi:hypothetical protein BN1723_014966 [Verticillium longisporum]|uniref:Uncharacterized protein n=1 Tax=Verticillium longisporum TaxID=100787 RepID=A0A0G4MLZ6_VERLO|nr:hypothetical protein BN1708_015021 [Verticillium longisporum]CRK35214.1 hypothetical protein BN1723_014966 [Verticillium longisporum]
MSDRYPCMYYNSGQCVAYPTINWMPGGHAACDECLSKGYPRGINQSV